MPATYPTTAEVAPGAEPAEAPTARETHGAASRAARAHKMVARVLFGGLALQLFFAGLGVFSITSFLPHAILGALIILTSFALPTIAWRGQLQTAIARRSMLLAGLMVLQGLVIDAGRIVPLISALHPINAMLLVLLTYSLV